MTFEEHMEMFQIQAIWLEHEYRRVMTAPGVMNWPALIEIRNRNAQLNREFEKFLASHPS